MSYRLIPDTSIIIDGRLPEEVERRTSMISEVIVPFAVLDELQAQASKGRVQGFAGLEELKRLREVCDRMSIALTFSGERPSLEDIRLARSGRIDALIVDTARKEGAILITGDYVQALAAEAQGVKVEYIPPKVEPIQLTFENFFTPDTASIHLKEDTPPLAKRGKPGQFDLVKIREEPLSARELEEIVKQISEATRISSDGFVEVSREGATVLQLGRYRVAITRPPFSDGLEVTIVRPVVSLTLKDYKLSEKLMRRLSERAEGILICGPPGSGKTTFAASLAEFYMQQGKIVKTLESPRDLQVRPEITQYGPLEGDFEKTAEILLLVRPDYSVFDEIRKTKDFQVFSDMRLAGVGMIGVVHASDAIDAVQRFIGRVELGMIPHIIDTIIFLKYGEIAKVYDLSLVVKIPSGMTEADLARPVVEVRGFEDGKLEYEIYTYGEENVIIPVQETAPESATRKLAAERILQEIQKYDRNAQVEVVSDSRAIVRVDNNVIPVLIGRKGTNINNLEEKLGIHIDVEPLTPSTGEEIDSEIREVGSRIELRFDKRYIGEVANVYIDDEYLFSATIGKKAQIRVSKKSDLGKALLRAMVGHRRIRVLR
jgi:ATPase